MQKSNIFISDFQTKKLLSIFFFSLLVLLVFSCQNVHTFRGFSAGALCCFFPPSVATVTGEVPTGAGKAEGGVGKSTEGGGRGGEKVPWRGVFAHQCTRQRYAEKCSSVLKKLSVSSQQERRILAETLMPLSPCSSGVTTSSRGEASSSSQPQDTIVRSLADWERKQELLERQSVNGWLLALMRMCSSSLNRVHFRAPWGLWCFDLADYFLVFHINREQMTGPVTSALLTTAWKQDEGLWKISSWHFISVEEVADVDFFKKM